MTQHLNSKINILLKKLKDENVKIDEHLKAKSLITSKLLKELSTQEKDNKKATLEQLVDLLGIDELSEPITRLLSQHKVPLSQAASFKRLLIQATRRRQLYSFQPEWKLNNKRNAYEFIDQLGIPRPKIYEQKKPIDSITLKPGSVLKPENGASSVGVFIIGENQNVQEVRTGEIVSTEEAIDKIKNYLNKGIIQKDVWMLEEFIGGFENNHPVPARDLKFYCFYGEAGFVLEVDRSNKARYCEWLPDGTLADTGRYTNNSFVGNGFSQQEKELAEEISRKVPTPFIRIDFLKSKDKFVFGEFTPRPGQFSSFNREFDRYLGECYLKAESRLLKSMLDRKADKL